MSTATKPFDYAAFIDELRVLRDSFAKPPSNHRTHESTEFKSWRHRINDLIDRIEAKGYDINCGLSGRQFRVMSYGSISPREQQSAFDKAHAETIIELDTIISNFEKFGDPKAPTPALAEALPRDVTLGQPLQWNKEATLSWYFKNTPAGTLWGFGAVVCSLIVGAFLLGIFVEKRFPEAKSPVTAVPAAKVLPQDPQPQPASAASK